jgi:hypothetical protein
MPRPRTKRPASRHYKPKNLAVVRIEGKDHYLGSFGSDESHSVITGSSPNGLPVRPRGLFRTSLLPPRRPC